MTAIYLASRSPRRRELLTQLGVAKQLLVRLRHSPQVRMERVGEAQFYIWQG